MRILKGFLSGFFLLATAWSTCLAQDSASSVNLDVKEFRLNNGMMFRIVERPTTPQIACRVAIRTGSALEESGKTGIAHMLEHMMFKGTKNFGTLDFKKDQELQKCIEAAYQVILEEQEKREPNKALIKTKFAEMDTLRLRVQKIYVPQAFSSQVGKNGAVGVNAFTTKDQTQFTMSVPSDMLEQWFSIVSEQLFEPSWREFYVEKEVVQREWAYRYVNSPGGAAWLDLYAMAFKAHPYHNPTIGWESDIRKYSARDAIEFHAKYYKPNNAVCVLVGDVRLENAKELAKIYFERYPSGRCASEEVTKEPEQHGPRKSVRFLKGARTPLIRIGFHSARMGTKDFYALDAMTMILSHGRSARMTQNIVNKGLAVSAWAHNPDNRYAGMVILGGSPNEPDGLNKKGILRSEKQKIYTKASEELEGLLLAEVDKLKTELVSERELERIKKLNRRDFLDRLRSNEKLAGLLATLEVQIGRRYISTYLEEIAEITPEEIRQVAKKYILRDNKTSVYVIPGGKPDKTPEHYTEMRSVSGSAAVKAVRTDTSSNHSIYPTPQGWKHPLSFKRRPKKIEYPKAEIAKVDNTTLFYLPDRELPLIDLTIFVKAGAIDVADSKIGLSGVFNRCLIRGGTEKYSPSELAIMLDENAIQLSVSVNEEDTVIRLSVMKDDWDKGLGMLEEILARPGFAPETLKVVKQQALIELKRQGGNAQTVCMREGTIWHFKGHPYGRDPLKGLETISDITREDLKGFLSKYFVPSNMVLAVAGDINKASVVKGLARLFSSLPRTGVPERKLDDPEETPPVLVFINKPGQLQAQVAMELRSLVRSNPDYWKVSLLMNIFGGSDSLIYKRLRDDLGIVYSAWFYQTYKWKAGMLIGYIGCKGDRTGQAIRETVKIMGALHKNVPTRDLEQKRLDVLNGFVFNVDTPAELVDVYGRYHMRNEPLDTLDRIQDSFITAKREELEALAGKLLNPAKLQIFVVGDKKTRIKKENNVEITLEEDIKILAKELCLPYKEMNLR